MINHSTILNNKSVKVPISCHSHGFTLVEILIAIVVFSVGLLGMAKLTINVIQSNVLNKKLTAATTFAYDKIEHIKTLGFANATTAAGTETWDFHAQLWNSASPTGSYASYKRVTDIDTTALPANMLIATVRVFWDHDARSVAVSTILTQ